MIKTFAQLKRDLQPGIKIKMIKREVNGKEEKAITEVREAIKLHLIEIAQNDDVKVETLEQAKNYIVDRFNLEVLRFARKNEPIQKLFTDWLNGLALHTHFYTGDIIDYLHSIGLYGKDEQQEQTKAADLYHYLIFKEVKNDIIKTL